MSVNRLSTRVLAASLVLAGGYGCNGSAMTDPGVVTDGPRVQNNRDGGSPAFRPDANRPEIPTFEARPDLPPPPPPNMMAKQLLPGRARLVGTHLDACSNQTPSSNGDRWCAFSLPGVNLGKTDLWVINVTKAAAGTVKCDQKNPDTDPNCIQLTTNLWTGQPDGGPAHPTAHRFDGDTLIYHADTPANVDLYSGPIYAWRPGWKEAKQVSSGRKAITCSAHFLTEAVVCLENITAQNVMPVQFDLTAGKLNDGAQPITRLTPLRANTQASQWRAGFSRDGQYFAWSTGGKTTSAADRETLYYVKVDDIKADGKAGDRAKTVVAGVSRWNISIDGKRWYYLKNYNYDTEGNPSGTLAMRPFPDGTDDQEVVLATKVGAFQLLSDGSNTDRGIGFFDNVSGGMGAFKIMRDVNKPDDVVTVIRGVSGALVSPDLRFVYYSQDFDVNTGSSDAWVVHTDGTGKCALQSSPTTDIFGAPFTSTSSLVFWADNIDPVDGVGEGWYANPEGCTGKKRWANGIDFWFIARDQGMLFSDSGTGDVATLKYMTLPGGNTLGSPVEIAQQMGRVYGVLPGFEATVFQITQGTNFDGLYVFANLPFKSSAAATPDGGAPKPDAAVAPKPDAATATPDAVSGTPPDAM